VPASAPRRHGTDALALPLNGGNATGQRRPKPEKYGVPDQWGWIDHGWFDPNKPAQAEDGDHHIEITNGRYVSVWSGIPEGRSLLGKIRFQNFE
jgi:hypothetical protein